MWSLLESFQKKCSFRLGLWEITLVSSLTFLSSTLCSVGQKLKPFYNSDVATYVRGTFDAFRTGHVSVLVKEPSSFVSF